MIRRRATKSYRFNSPAGFISRGKLLDTSSGLAFAKVNVKPARVSRIDVDPATVQVSIGGTLKLSATPRVSNENRHGFDDRTWEIVSSRQ